MREKVSQQGRTAMDGQVDPIARIDSLAVTRTYDGAHIPIDGASMPHTAPDNREDGSMN